MLAQSITPRRYQEVIFHTATQKNTLVVLPTGLGKTMIAAMLVAQRLSQYPKTKIIFLAPTKPLAEQHFDSFKKLFTLPEEDFTLFTGSVSPSKREEQYKSARIIFSTPQGLENDVMSNRISLRDVSLLVFDEAHRATGDYSYVFLAKAYHNMPNAHILALTASPGTDKEKITEVCQNLFIQEIEVRKETDADVEPYVQEVDFEWVEVPFPESLREIQQTLQKCYVEKLTEVKQLGFLSDDPSSISKSQLLKIQGELHGMLASGEKDFDVMKSVSILAQAMKVQHAIELIETQGVSALKSYLKQLQSQAGSSSSKATKNLVQDVLFKKATVLTNNLVENHAEHPKINVVKKIVLQNILENKHAQTDTKIIIFTQYRDQAVVLEKALQSINIASKVFVGQAKKKTTGLSQKEQKAMLDEFSSGAFPVLIATSVAEEGLDIPKVDAVLFYEPVPSAIRTVQRRGRTGRLEKGKVIVLVTKGTRDVGYRWVAHHKEKRMYRALTDVKKTLTLSAPEKITSKNSNSKNISHNQQSLSHFTNSEQSKEVNSQFTIVCDHREKGSPVLKSLLDLGVRLDLQQLSVGDFLISDRVVIEYKTVPDFVNSIIDGRLLTQLKNLKQYSRPLLILEGDQDIYSQRNIHANAIRGMLATITISYGIALISTKNPLETAHLMYAIARREHIGAKEFQQHQAKSSSENEQLETILSAIPTIGSTLAKPLLSHFKTIYALVHASVDELQMVEKIGKKKAEIIHEVLRREYDINE